MPAIASLEDLKAAQKGKLLSTQSALLSTDERWVEKCLLAVVGRANPGTVERGRRVVDSEIWLNVKNKDLTPETVNNDFSSSSQFKWTPSMAVEETTVLASSASRRFESLR